MRVLTPKSIMWPRIPEDMSDEWKLYFRKMQNILDDFVKDVHHDIADGNVAHKISDAVPGVDDLNEGELYLYDNLVDTRTLYTRLNGILRKIDWT